MVQELTKNHKLLNTSIDRLSTSGSTALYDAIAAANFKLSRETGKKVIINLLTINLHIKIEYFLSNI
jgi:hypothetical protein